MWIGAGTARELCMFLVGSVVLNVTFNNIAAISRRSVLVVDEIGVPGRP